MRGGDGAAELRENGSRRSGIEKRIFCGRAEKQSTKAWKSYCTRPVDASLEDAPGLSRSAIWISWLVSASLEDASGFSRRVIWTSWLVSLLESQAKESRLLT